MNKGIEYHLDSLLNTYTGEKYLQCLIKAKELYFSMTGKVDEEDEEYEWRMNSFNDWYLFEHVNDVIGTTPVLDYVENKTLELNIAHALTNIRYSLFEYTGTNLRKKHVLKDYVSDEKVVVENDEDHFPLMKNDLFIGRVIPFGKECYLLNGLRTLPGDARTPLRKKAKMVRKKGAAEDKKDFLFKVEQLRTRWKNYNHLSPAKFFSFEG